MAKAQTTAPTLQEQLTAKQAEMIETRRSHAAGELVNPRAITRIRKEIARIQTQMNQPQVAAQASETEEKEENK